MPAPDLNLLLTLDVLLAEGSVAGAAKRLNLSASAMSRALARLRETTGDPLLVRAGRGLVPTPRALRLRQHVHQLVVDADSVLRPEGVLDVAKLDRVFTLRTSDGFVENFGPKLIKAVGKAAPLVRLNFMQKTDKQSGLLRDGRVDLETGVVEETLGPEVRTQALFRDQLVAAVRAGHPLAAAKMTAQAYKEGLHVIVSRSGAEDGAVDRPFLPPRLKRNLASIVSGFSAALALARDLDLIATVPERHTETLRKGMISFPVPLPGKGFTVSMLWHPRMDADPAHRWLRDRVRKTCSDRPS
jgi:DNA-binding transcriptional LysR family regulator